MNDLLTVSETAAYLRLSRAQVYVLITQKKISHIRLGQKRVVIRKTELEKWLESHTTTALS
jgi:excisionase family DNA binding protein